MNKEEGPGSSPSWWMDGSSTSAGSCRVRWPGEGDLSMVDATTSSAGAEGAWTVGLAAVLEPVGRTAPLPVPGTERLGGILVLKSGVEVHSKWHSRASSTFQPGLAYVTGLWLLSVLCMITVWLSGIMLYKYTFPLCYKQSIYYGGRGASCYKTKRKPRRNGNYWSERVKVSKASMVSFILPVVQQARDNSHCANCVPFSLFSSATPGSASAGVTGRM